MVNITKINCNYEVEVAVIHIQLEKDSETITIHSAGCFVDVTDSQGYCDDWVFVANGTVCDVEYSRFEEYSFDEQVAYQIVRALYPSEKIEIFLN